MRSRKRHKINHSHQIEAKQGTILFGGIDTVKFRPPLLSVSIVVPAEFYLINLTSVSTGIKGQQDLLTSFEMSQPVQVQLDSGSEEMVTYLCLIWRGIYADATKFLPSPLASAIQADAGAQVLRQFQYPIINCDQSTNQSTLRFGFGGDGGPVIAVPKGELVIPRFDSKGVQLTYNGAAVCEFGVWSQQPDYSTSTFIMGDTFLRSAYVVCGLASYLVSSNLPITHLQLFSAYRTDWQCSSIISKTTPYLSHRLSTMSPIPTSRRSPTIQRITTPHRGTGDPYPAGHESRPAN